MLAGDRCGALACHYYWAQQCLQTIAWAWRHDDKSGRGAHSQCSARMQKQKQLRIANKSNSRDPRFISTNIHSCHACANRSAGRAPHHSSGAPCLFFRNESSSVLVVGKCTKEGLVAEMPAHLRAQHRNLAAWARATNPCLGGYKRTGLHDYPCVRVMSSTYA